MASKNSMSAMFGFIVYVDAAFEAFIGYNMFMDPGALHDGYQPKKAYEVYAFEMTGIACKYQHGLRRVCRGGGLICWLPGSKGVEKA